MKSSNLIVLIPHFNNVNGLKTSLMSIQENIEIDILIVDDGSKEKFDENDIVRCYGSGKIIFEYLQKNSGIEHALNQGLNKIKQLGYKYVARLDCGDKCKPQKFEKQLDYLTRNSNIKLLGTWANVVDELGNHLHYIKHPIKYSDIKKGMYINSMFVHPTVIFQTSILDKVGNYPTNFKAAEDYAFFFNIIKEFQAENLPEILLDYEYSDSSISSSKRKLQVKSRLRVIRKHFYFGITPIYGILRNYILLFVSRKGATKLKSLIIKN